jgi:hypothetical protein
MRRRVCTKLQRLGAHLRYQVSPQNAFRKTGIVLDPIGVHNLAAEHLPFSKENLAAQPAAIDSSTQAGHSATNNYHIVRVHLLLS